MTVVVKKIDVQKRDECRYIPHKIRSRPFYFIGLPFLGVLVTMFYWLILCPLLFVHFWIIFVDVCCWHTYFWIAALIIFIIIFSVLVCVWRCSPRRNSDDHYKIIIEEKDELDSTNDMMLKEMPKQVDDEIKTIEEEKMFPRCSVRQKTRPQSLALNQEDHRPVSQNLSSPLTPRELFFIDLIETANRSCSSTTHTFLEKEKEHYSPDDNYMKCSLEDRQKSGSPSEFFIANIPEENTCTSQVFLYVEPNDSEPQFTITCESAAVVID